MADAPADPNPMRKLRWRCRRGMQELDTLLLRFLEREWTSASEDRRAVFLQLLETEDDRLWRWFLGHETAPDAELDTLVQHIRTLPP